MFNNLVSNVSSKGRSSNQKKQTLQMTLVALKLDEDGVGKQQIADMLGITKHTLQFRVFENKGQFKDTNGIPRTKCRSIKRFLYVDHTDPNNDEIVSEDEFYSRLFDHYGEKYKGGDEGKEQIEEILESWAEQQTDKVG